MHTVYIYIYIYMYVLRVSCRVDVFVIQLFNCSYTSSTSNTGDTSNNSNTSNYSNYNSNSTAKQTCLRWYAKPSCINCLRYYY